MKALLDTSVLIEGSVPQGLDVAISSVSIAELHFGVHVAKGEEAREIRTKRLGLIESRFPDPLPVDDRVAREWGHLQAIVARRGGKPRSRGSDLAIAATAIVHRSALITHNSRDFKLIEDQLKIIPA